MVWPPRVTQRLARGGMHPLEKRQARCARRDPGSWERRRELGRGPMMNKVYTDAAAALAGLVKDGMTIMAGGFGLCGVPDTLIHAIRDSGAKNLTFVSNNAGIDGAGLGLLLETR